MTKNETYVVIACALGSASNRVGTQNVVPARGLAARATALGAMTIALSPDVIAFAWEVDSFEEAVVFACSAIVEEPSARCSAMSAGPLQLLHAENPYGVQLALGEPLARAFALLSRCEPRDVLIDATVEAVTTRLLSCHLVGGGDSGSVAYRLNLEAPWSAESGVTPARSSRPPDMFSSTETYPALAIADAIEDHSDEGSRTARVEDEDITLVVNRSDSMSWIVGRSYDPDAPTQAPPPPPRIPSRCRELLSSGWAHALSRQYDAALLDVVEGLARARESGDEKGVFVAHALLAKLCLLTGRTEDAARVFQPTRG